VGAVELPDQGEEYEGGDPAVVSGWGTLSSGGQASDVLMKVEVPIVSDTSEYLQCPPYTVVIFWKRVVLKMFF
jgi:Trypsin